VKPKEGASGTRKQVFLYIAYLIRGYVKLSAIMGAVGYETGKDIFSGFVIGNSQRTYRCEARGWAYGVVNAWDWSLWIRCAERALIRSLVVSAHSHSRSGCCGS